MLLNKGKLAIIPSGRPKIWDKQPSLKEVPASQAYTGTFHRLCQQYVTQNYVNWVIISPKYGILKPEDLCLGPYDFSFAERNKNQEVIRLETMKEQLKEKGLLPVKEVIMLGGKKFQPIMEELFGPDVSYRFPLHGLRGIGDMQRVLKDAIENGKEL